MNRSGSSADKAALIEVPDGRRIRPLERCGKLSESNASQSFEHHVALTRSPSSSYLQTRCFDTRHQGLILLRLEEADGALSERDTDGSRCRVAAYTAERRRCVTFPVVHTMTKKGTTLVESLTTVEHNGRRRSHQVFIHSVGERSRINGQGTVHGFDSTFDVIVAV